MGAFFMLGGAAHWRQAVDFSMRSGTWQPYNQADIGDDECMSPLGTGQLVPCQEIGFLWMWPINTKEHSASDEGVAYDVGVKKMAEMINREQWLLPGYRLVPLSVDDGNNEYLSYYRAKENLIANNHKQWAALGSIGEASSVIMSQFSEILSVPMVSVGIRLSAMLQEHPTQINHMWNFSSAAGVALRLLRDKGLTHIAIVSDDHLDPGGNMLMDLKAICESLGVKVTDVHGVRVSGHQAEFALKDMKAIHLLDAWRLSSVKAALIFSSSKMFLQELLCEAFKQQLSEMLFILPYSVTEDFFKGVPDSMGCSRADLLSTGDFLRVDGPRARTEEVDVNDDQVLGCFSPNGTIDHVRSRNGTARRFMAQMQDVVLQAPGRWPSEDPKRRLPGLASDAMCQVAKLIRALFDQGVTLEEVLEHNPGLFHTSISIVKDMTFNGAWGVVKFSGEHMREWKADISLWQNGTFRKAAMSHSATTAPSFVPGFVPLWSNGDTGWDKLPISTLPACPPTMVVRLNTCVNCGYGMEFVKAKRSCAPCPIGRAKDTTASCEDCPAGKYSEDKGMRTCTACARGAYSASVRTSACLKCDQGKMANSEGKTECTLCPRGRYSTDVGSSECVSCTSSDVPVYHELFRLYCPCPAGTYYAGWPSYGLGSPQYKTSCSKTMVVDKSASTGSIGYCVTCGPGLICDGDERYRGCGAPRVKPGYMMISALTPGQELPDKMQVYVCRDTKECPGTANLWSQQSMCGAGRVGLACGTCPEGSSLDSGTGCRRCATRHNIGSLCILFFLCPFFAAWLYRTVNKYNLTFADTHGSEKEAQTWSELMSRFNLEAAFVIDKTFAILLSFLQTLALVGVTAKARPFWFQFIFLFGRILNFEIEQLNMLSDFFQVACILGQNFLRRFSFTLSFPLFIAFLFGLNLVLDRFVLKPLKYSLRRRGFSFIVKTGLKASFNFDKTVNAIGSQTRALYIGLVSVSTSLWVTYDHPGQDLESVLRYPDITMGSPQWWQAFPFAVVGLMLYCFGVFAGCVYVVYVAPANYHQLWFRQRYFFLLSGFRVEVWWWGVVLLIKGILVNFIVVLIRSTKIMCLFMLCLFVIFLVLNFIYKPWPCRSQTICETFCSVCICLILPCTALRADEVETTRFEMSLDANAFITLTEETCVVLPPIVALLCMFIPVYTFVKRKRSAVMQFRKVQSLRNLMYLIMTFSNRALNSLFLTLDDVEQQTITSAMAIICTRFLRMQPTANLWEQRLIAGASEHEVAHDWRIMRMVDDAITSGHDAKDVFIERVKAQWFLDQLDESLHQALVAGPVPNDSSHSAARRARVAASLSRARRQMADEANYIGTVASSRLSDIWTLLAESNGMRIGREEFVDRATNMAPQVPRHVAQEVFTLVDTDRSGELSKDEFCRVFSGIVVDPSDKHRELERRELQRLASRLQGGRYASHSAQGFNKKLTQLQRAFRFRRTLSQASQSVDRSVRGGRRSITSRTPGASDAFGLGDASSSGRNSEEETGRHAGAEAQADRDRVPEDKQEAAAMEPEPVLAAAAIVVPVPAPVPAAGAALPEPPSLLEPPRAPERAVPQEPVLSPPGVALGEPLSPRPSLAEAAVEAGAEPVLGELGVIPRQLVSPMWPEAEPEAEAETAAEGRVGLAPPMFEVAPLAPVASERAKRVAPTLRVSLLPVAAGGDMAPAADASGRLASSAASWLAQFRKPPISDSPLKPKDKATAVRGERSLKPIMPSLEEDETPESELSIRSDNSGQVSSYSSLIRKEAAAWDSEERMLQESLDGEQVSSEHGPASEWSVPLEIKS